MSMDSISFQQKYFIENDTDASYWKWLMSKGTSYQCYYEYQNSLGEQDKINNIIDLIRAVIYAIHRPLKFVFFSWTLLILILYKFNFKNKVIKIILCHFALRSLGDVVDGIGDIFPHYFSVVRDQNNNIIGCNIDSSSPESHPLKWVLTRQLGNILWYSGEIVADWYPLLRTREIVNQPSAILNVYTTCGIFNLSKIIIIIYHFRLSPTKLYKEDGTYNKDLVNEFYLTYWIIQLIIIYASVFYDFSVYRVLKKYSFQISNSNVGFVKKFKIFSEYRLCVSTLISIVFLPIVSLAIIMKIYFWHKGMKNLEFSFEEIRCSIANLQYLIIFIDQILLYYSNSLGIKIPHKDSDPKSFHFTG